MYLPRPHCALSTAVALACASIVSQPAAADIYRWDNGQPIAGTTGLFAVPNTNFASKVLPYADFRSANLTSSSFFSANLDNADFTSANLTGVTFAFGSVVSTNFTDADVRGAILIIFGPGAMTPAQLASTASYKTRDLHGTRMPASTGLDFSSFNLSDASFVGADTAGANFTSANITRAKFSGITPAQLYSTLNYAARDLTSVSFDGCDLTNADLSSQTLVSANFKHATLASATFLSANLQYATLQTANLASASFISANLTNAELSSANLTGANFAGASVQFARFYDATNFTADQLYATASYQAHDLTGIQLKNGVGWNFASQNLFTAFFNLANMASANFTSANLASVTFASATVTGANLTGATLTGTSFRNAVGFTASQLTSSASYQAHNLSGISLSGLGLPGIDLSSQNLSTASLTTANFTSADFSSANLTNAFLSSANFTGALLANVNFSAAGLSSTNFTLADLRNATNFTPDAKTILRGTILPNATVNAFTLNTGETFRVRSGPAVTLLGTLTTSNNSTIQIDAGTTVTGPALTGAAGTIFNFTLTTPAAPAPLTITATDGLTLNAASLLLTDNSAPQGYYKLIGYTGNIQGAGPGAMTLPTAPPNFAYYLDTQHDPGFIDLHKVLLGDVNGDNSVDGADFDTWYTHLQMPNPTYADGDLNSDGQIDGADFDFWFTHLQNTFGSASADSPSTIPNSPFSPVPEPASVTLLVPALVLMIRRRKP